jgi:hypothetical protein
MLSTCLHQQEAEAAKQQQEAEARRLQEVWILAAPARVVMCID